MQYNQDNPDKSATRPRLVRTRFVGVDTAQQARGSVSTTGAPDNKRASETIRTPQKKAARAGNKAARPDLDSSSTSSNQNTAHLMQLSGMMRAIRKSDATPSVKAVETEEDGYWPLGIQQAGPLPIVNLYGRTPFGRTLPTAIPLVMAESVAQDKEQASWKRALSTPAFKISLGLLIGLGLLLLAWLFIDLSTTLALLGAHLGTPQGIGLALLAGIVYLGTHSIRGLRWRLFLGQPDKIGALKIIELYQVAALLNFLLPLRAGEAAKSLALKRVANIPVSKSLPTVAMDKALDLLAALVILALVPFLGISMDLKFWLVLGIVGGVLLALAVFIGLVTWKRTLALGLLQTLFGLLPRSISGKIEGFIIGFVDALLAGASQPKTFLPALLYTGLAVLADGLFIMLAFSTIGYSVSFGVALFGCMVFSLFSILPTPPGQFGSNEIVGLLVFSGLLSLPSNAVAAMYIFSHLWIALLLTAAGLGSLAALGLNLTSALHTPEQ